MVKRANVLRSDNLPGSMATIATSDDRIAQYTEMGLQDQVSIAVYNAADSNVVSA